jgi:hypothetical protein
MAVSRSVFKTFTFKNWIFCPNLYITSHKAHSASACHWTFLVSHIDFRENIKYTSVHERLNEQGFAHHLAFVNAPPVNLNMTDLVWADATVYVCFLLAVTSALWWCWLSVAVRMAVVLTSWYVNGRLRFNDDCNCSTSYKLGRMAITQWSACAC